VQIRACIKGTKGDAKEYKLIVYAESSAKAVTRCYEAFDCIHVISATLEPITQGHVALESYVYALERKKARDEGEKAARSAILLIAIMLMGGSLV
jgi:hypothetical protein